MKTPILPVTIFPGSANLLVLRPISFGETGPVYYWELQDAAPGADPIRRADGNVTMTAAQWNDWPAGDAPELDEAYQLACVAQLLGLTPA